MSGYTEDELEDWLTKIDDVNKKVGCPHHLIDFLGERIGGRQDRAGGVRQEARSGGEALNTQGGDQGQGASGGPRQGTLRQGQPEGLQTVLQGLLYRVHDRDSEVHSLLQGDYY